MSEFPDLSRRRSLAVADALEQLVSRADELEAAVRDLRMVEERLQRERRVAVALDRVNSHVSHMLALVYEASGAPPQDFAPIDRFVGAMRRKIEAVEAMGYEWRWTRSIDGNGEQYGAWVMRDADEADANNERFRRTDGE